MIRILVSLLAATAFVSGCATYDTEQSGIPGQTAAGGSTPQPVAAPAPTPAPAPAAAKPKPKPVAEKVTFAADVFFDFNKAVITPEGKSKLDDLSGKMRGINLEMVIVIGHTDAIGSDGYNQVLSVRRAEAAKAYLVSKATEGNRVYTEGKGKKQPIASNQTKEGRDKNRRAEIEVIGTRK